MTTGGKSRLEKLQEFQRQNRPQDPEDKPDPSKADTKTPQQPAEEPATATDESKTASSGKKNVFGIPADHVNVHVHMRDPRTTWGSSKRQKVTPEAAPKPETKTDYEDHLLSVCQLIAGYSPAIGKLERLWDQKSVDAWRARNEFEMTGNVEGMMQREDVDQSYKKFLTTEGFAIINQAKTMIALCNKQGKWTLADVLDNELFWNDFAGLASKVRTLNTQSSLGGAGRYFTAVSFLSVRDTLQKDIAQHLLAFQTAKRRPGGGWEPARL
jgi:hypothetical protein